MEVGALLADVVDDVDAGGVVEVAGPAKEARAAN